MQELAEPAEKPDLAVRDSLVQHFVVALGDAISVPFSHTCLHLVQRGRAIDVGAGVTVRDKLLLHVSEESSAVHLVDILDVATLVPALLVVGDIHRRAGALNEERGVHQEILPHAEHDRDTVHSAAVSRGELMTYTVLAALEDITYRCLRREERVERGHGLGYGTSQHAAGTHEFACLLVVLGVD